jgi:hypothetical protein
MLFAAPRKRLLLELTQDVSFRVGQRLNWRRFESNLRSSTLQAFLSLTTNRIATGYGPLGVVSPMQRWQMPLRGSASRSDDFCISVKAQNAAAAMDAFSKIDGISIRPSISAAMISDLKFNSCLSENIATSTIATRLLDRDGIEVTLQRKTRLYPRQSNKANNLSRGS